MDQLYTVMRRDGSSRNRRRRGWLVVRGAALAGAGLWLGALASAYTSETLRPLAPAAFARAADSPPGDSGEGGRAWARHAYGVGLRECPRVTEAFHAACSAQMSEEAKLAAQAALWQAADALTEAPAYIPEPPPLAEPEPGPERDPPDAVPGQLVPAIYVVEEAPAQDDVDGVVPAPEVAAAPPVSSPPAD